MKIICEVKAIYPPLDPHLKDLIGLYAFKSTKVGALLIDPIGGKLVPQVLTAVKNSKKALTK